MQNLMIGASGSGKGYEGCVYQILPALQKGRKVITNMPLDLDKWRLLDPSFVDLIELRKVAQPIRGTWEPTREEGAFNLWPDGRVVLPPATARPFAGVWDYYSDWKHPETGQGPLFVVDEAQYVIPRMKTDIQVEEWSALHRHFNSDILWMTQSYGKLSQTVRDNVQMVYRLRKKVAWGQPDRYIRKVQDGIRGEVMNTTERRYEKRYFGLWKSHTQGIAAEEFNAEDIKPFYQHWTFRGAAICLTLGLGTLIFLGNPFTVKTPPKVAEEVAEPVVINQAQVVETPVPDSAAPPRGEQKKVHPYQGYTLHLIGLVRSNREGGEYLNGYVVIANNGQPFNTVSFEDLRTTGYDIVYHSPTVVSLTYSGYDIGYVIADTPKVGLASKVPGNG